MITRLKLALSLLPLLAACVTPPPAPVPETPAPSPEAAETPAPAGVIARDERFAVYVPRTGDTLESVARELLGSESRAWEIAGFNGISALQQGEAIAVPLRPVNPLGVSANGYQTVPILCYHRLGPQTNLMVMPRETFAAQMEYLARNNYNVVRLADLPDFLVGRRPLPPRAVVITFDDGHISAYRHAYPILRKHGFPATLFVYTDFLGRGDGMTWAQLNEMSRSGLIDIQSHSKTHANLVVRLPGESEERYRARVDGELRIARDVIERNVPGKVTHHAFPYGDANQVVLDRLVQTGHQLGLTVNPGGNAFFAYPLMLRRTMIFGNASLESFRSALQVFREQNLR